MMAETTGKEPESASSTGAAAPHLENKEPLANLVCSKKNGKVQLATSTSAPIARVLRRPKAGALSEHAPGARPSTIAAGLARYSTGRKGGISSFAFQ